MTLPSLNPGPINHVALASADPAAGSRFYREVLGFHELPRPSFPFDGSWLYREGVGFMVHLIKVPGHEPATGPINTLWPHVALCADDLDAVERGLQAHGLDYVERVLPDHGYRQLFFRDPDGNLLEVGEWPAVDEQARQLQTLAGG